MFQIITTAAFLAVAYAGIVDYHGYGSSAVLSGYGHGSEGHHDVDYYVSTKGKLFLDVIIPKINFY